MHHVGGARRGGQLRGATTGGPDVLAAANITGTYALVRAMLLAGTPARLVHLGSAAEYGARRAGRDPSAESAPPGRARRTGSTKLAGTRLVELGRAAGLDAVVLRVFNPVGRRGAREQPARPGGRAAAPGPATAAPTSGSARWTRSATSSTPATSPPRCSPPRPRPALPHAVLNVGSGTGGPGARPWSRS